MQTSVTITPEQKILHDCAAERKTVTTVHVRDAVIDRKKAKNEILSMAENYNSLFNAVKLKPGKECRWFVTGHQPEFSHPGILIKNALAAQLAGNEHVALNIIVDSAPVAASFLYPAVEQSVALVRRGSAEPAAAHNQVYEKTPLPPLIYEQLSKIVQKSPFDVPALSVPHCELLRDQITAWRKKCEQRAGIAILDVPITFICQTHAYHQFVMEIIKCAHEFTECYNRILQIYRSENKIRNQVHPAPDLNTDGDTVELPFWHIDEHSVKHPVYLTRRGNDIVITAHNEKHYQGSAAGFNDYLCEASAVPAPRALLLSLFCRLVVADVFIHGTGGARYDRLTERLAEDFFHVTLPPFATATGTLRLPWETIPNVKSFAEHKSELHDRRQHPERFLDNSPQAQKLRSQHQRLIDSFQTADNKKQVHDNLQEIKAAMRAMMGDETRYLRQTIDRLAPNALDSDPFTERTFPWLFYPTPLLNNFLSRVHY